MKKTLFVFMELLRGVVSQKIRFVLTAVGILFGVFIFSLGLILTDSWYRTQTEEARYISENSMVITGSNSRMDGISALQQTTAAESVLFLQERISRVLVSTTLAEGRNLQVRATLLGLSAGEMDGVSFSMNSTALFPSSFRLKAGRGILNADNRNGACVAVIDAFTERLLFGEGNGLGQTIRLTSSIGVAGQGGSMDLPALTVVGIAEDDYYAGLQPYALRSGYLNGTGQVVLNVRIYVPAGILSEEMCTEVYLFRFPDEASYMNASRLLQHINEEYGYFGRYLVSSRESFLEETEMRIGNTRRIIFLIMALVIAMSALTVLSILLFSTKERFAEIGIRKAFGASGAEIALQFVLEAALLGLFSAAAAFVLAWLAAHGIRELISNHLFIYFQVHFRAQYLYLTVLAGLLLSSLSSLVPALYASRVQVVDAMRLT